MSIREGPTLCAICSLIMVGANPTSDDAQQTVLKFRGRRLILMLARLTHLSRDRPRAQIARVNRAQQKPRLVRNSEASPAAHSSAMVGGCIIWPLLTRRFSNRQGVHHGYNGRQ